MPVDSACSAFMRGDAPSGQNTNPNDYTACTLCGRVRPKIVIGYVSSLHWWMRIKDYLLTNPPFFYINRGNKTPEVTILVLNKTGRILLTVEGIKGSNIVTTFLSSSISYCKTFFNFS
jgi:hypothetical protein